MRIPAFAFLVLAAAACGDRKDETYPRTTPVDTDGARTNDVDRKTVPDADNTARNERDKSGATVTPVDQGNNQADIDRTAEIRKRIVDANLGTDATNVKVVTLDGKVTLRGPVETQAEKDAISRIATEVAGEVNVTNQLEVASGR